MWSFSKNLSTGNASIDYKIKNIGKKHVKSTVGAVVSKNEKGETTMENVRVKRYVAGKLPEYAKVSDDELIQDKNVDFKGDEGIGVETELREITVSTKESVFKTPSLSFKLNLNKDKVEKEIAIEEAEPETVDDEDAAMKRRMILREKALQKQNQMEESKSRNMYHLESDAALSTDRGGAVEDEDSEDDYSEYTEEEEEETIPRLKPVFVRKQDRVTLTNNYDTEKNIAEELDKNKLLIEDRRIESKRIITSIRNQEMLEEQNVETVDQIIITDDEEDDEAEFEAWKLRELKRMKRDIEERQQREEELIELEKIRNMTEEERNKYFEENPKLITNESVKSQYRYLQKYFHKGVFYMDEDNELLKRNFAAPTLEDHFDKSVLPSVLQVKNFGKAGRTKYTHLTDQDTTDHMLNKDAASACIPEFQSKFGQKVSAGVKPVFEKPSFKRKRKSDKA